MNGCVSYAAPWLVDAHHCPVCEAPRFKSDGTTRSTSTYCRLGPFLDASMGNAPLNQEMIDIHQQGIIAEDTNSSIVTDFADSLHHRALVAKGPNHPDGPLVTDDDFLIGHTANGANLTPHRNREEAIYLNAKEARILNVSPRRRYKHNMLYITNADGPEKPQDGGDQATSFYWPLLNETDELESRWVWSAAKKKWVQSRCFVTNIAADKAELEVMSNQTGTKGASSSFHRHSEGVWRHSRYYLVFKTPSDTGDPDYQPLTRRDLATRGSQPSDNHEPCPLRDFDEDEQSAAFVTDMSNPKSARDARQKATGIRGPSIFINLYLYKIFYPYIYAVDSTHLLYANYGKEVAGVVFGKGQVETKNAPTLSPDQTSIASQASMYSRLLKPSQHGAPVRSIDDKLMNFKCGEIRTLINQELTPLLYGSLDDEDNRIDYYIQVNRLFRMFEAAVFDIHAPYDEGLVMYELDDLGRRVIPNQNMIVECTKVSLQREELYIDRDAEFIARATPTIFRLIDLGPVPAMWGGTSVGDQWGLERVVGDMKRKGNSCSTRVETIRKNNTLDNAAILNRLLYSADYAIVIDKLDPDSSNSSAAHTTHPRIPNIVLSMSPTVMPLSRSGINPHALRRFLLRKNVAAVFRFDGIRAKIARPHLFKSDKRPFCNYGR
ncbi:BQ2448_6991 [Microbotryum intermedium]|uniref:BQ2448_6991 protein n=1 Tax=Microbotryum intermedium TaxID=269621 RepID=A0A238FPP8_9BASI|nr:BQ2448_6991 [Microbotryum intermedium]